MRGTDCSKCNRSIPPDEPGRILEGMPVCRQCADEQDPRCPYCHESLPKLPKRKTKCPHCDNEIVVRSRQTLFASSLLTQIQAFELKWLPVLESHGISESEYSRLKRDLQNQRAGFSTADFVWAAFNKATHADVYRKAFDMGRFLFETGRDPTMQISIALDARLGDLERVGVRYVEINSAGCCSSCRKMHGLRLSIEEARAKKLIPQSCCIRESSGEGKPAWCLCDYRGDFESI